MNMIPKAVRLKHQGENSVPNYGSNLRTMIFILVSEEVPPPRSNHPGVYKLVTMVVPSSVFSYAWAVQTSLFSWVSPPGCYQPHPPGLMA